MSELVAFLEARLAEDEAVARAASLSSQEPGPWWVDGPALNSGLYWVYATEAKFTQPLATHVARHDPARVLREVAAKRAILAAHRRQVKDDDPNAYIVRFGVLLRALAAPFSDHPDFQEQWR